MRSNTAIIRAGRRPISSMAIRTTCCSRSISSSGPSRPSGTIIVDTGMDEATGKKREREITRPVREGLAALGIAADKVGKVILSHLHYDHCGNYDLFPQAHYHLQDREMAYATGRWMCHQALRLPFEVDDVVSMVRKAFAGRVAFHDGEDEIVPGVTVHRIGGHSKGLQSVRVKTRLGHVVLAADASHLYAHIIAAAPSAHHRYRRSCRGLRDAQAARLIAAGCVPGDDPLVLARYPAAKPGLEGWIVRLDAEPKAN